MNDLLEIVFDDLNKLSTVNLLNEIIFCNKIKNKLVRVLVSEKELVWRNIIDIKFAVEKIDNKSILINFNKIDEEKFSIINPCIRVIKYNEKFEIAILFNMDDLLCLTEKTKAIFDFTSSLAIKHEVKKFYCGIEPAADAGTRLFTNYELGPISI